jgi:hypothetical protein
MFANAFPVIKSIDKDNASARSSHHHRSFQKLSEHSDANKDKFKLRCKLTTI